MSTIRTRLTRTIAQHPFHAAHQRQVASTTTRRQAPPTHRVSTQATPHTPPIHLSVR